MTPVFLAAVEIQSVLEARRFAFCFIGGVAVQLDRARIWEGLRPLLGLREDVETEPRLRVLLGGG